MRIKLIFFLLFVCFYGHAQYGKIQVDYSVETSDTTYRIGIYEYTTGKAIYFKNYDCDDSPLFLDSIIPGQYILKVMNGTGSRELYLYKRFEVFSNQMTLVSAYLDMSVIYHKKDTSDVKSRPDGEIHLAYLDDKLINPKSVFSNGFLLGFTIHQQNSFSKHLSYLVGYGFSYRYLPVLKDTSFFASGVSYKKKHEAYNYLDMHLDFKIRLSGGSQWAPHARSQKLLLELGGIYNFPIYFRYVGQYSGNKKIEARGIHQFCDFRAFVNAGYYPFVFFYEYRLSDFIIGNYPELPRSTFGLRIFFNVAISTIN